MQAFVGRSDSIVRYVGWMSLELLWRCVVAAFCDYNKLIMAGFIVLTSLQWNVCRC